ncbi:phosphotransferase family protein [Sphingomonas sp. BIUV-7]|uniref:Phosphotransferase family protein n=1 Tax=Sphingomonas natans TaxID=3063330 RepID=A0ABT8Y839_9SPHN|nr:phosphotransferase family protein [Sphingomonas sp. BIUV-7]MDO6414488.1 phosphotransferase family protein [Sphingomonas sp. BIUV-7]
MADVEVMARALRDYLPDGDRITRIVSLTTGFSNETYRIEGLDLILRLPPSAGAMLDGHDVIAQARIYEELGRRPDAPRVPKIVAICDTPEILGVPFFVMERLPGEAIDDLEMQAWFAEGSDALRADICRQWVAAYAGLSRLAPLDILGAPVAPEEDARTWRAFALKAQSPRLAGLFDRLLSVPAPRSGPPGLIHGDSKLANILWVDGQVGAVLDWEMALNGEPLANLGYMLYALESKHHAATRAYKLSGMLVRDEVIALWEEISGRSAEGLVWHEIAQMGKLAAIIAEGANMFASGRSSDPKLTIFARSLEYYIGVMQSMIDDAGF